jgi:hypothetical protein
MLDIAADSRVVYRPSGKVDWIKFLPGFAMAVIAAIAIAWCLFGAYRKGFYLIIVAPLIAALAVGGVWYLILTWSHCRNRAVATLASVVLGSLLYLGYYHIDLLSLIGVQNAHRVDILPKYVRLRMMIDVARDARLPDAKPRHRRGPDAVQRGFNWLFFGAELALVMGVLVGIGRNVSSKAFCEPCGKWMRAETLKLAPGAGAAAWDALQRGDQAALRLNLGRTSGPQAMGSVLTIEHCPSCPAEDRSNAVYLTVKDVPAPGMPEPLAVKVGALFKPKYSAHLRSFADHVGLFPEEVGILAAGFPALKGTIESHPGLFAEAQLAARAIERAEAAAVDQRTERVARIEAVEPNDAGTVLTRANAIKQTIVGVFSVFGGFVLALAPVGVLAALDPKPPEWAYGIALVWMFACMAINLGWMLFFARYPTSRFMLGQTRRAFELRANPAVDLNDPDLVFVDIIPRHNWGKVMMENATDIGFLQLDARRRQLIFEGDRERYWIPVESILEVKHEFWAEAVQHQLQSSPTLNHLIVVRAMTARGPWETWFYQRQNHFRIYTAKRRLADALELENKIRDLMRRST